MSWIPVGDDMLINLDDIKAIERRPDGTCEIITSASESIIAPIEFSKMKAILVNQTNNIQKSLRTLAQGQRTMVP